AKSCSFFLSSRRRHTTSKRDWSSDVFSSDLTGQDAVNVAENFNEQLDVTGVVLTKLDGDTRGGAALSIKAMTNKPIKFAGMGERSEERRVGKECGVRRLLEQCDEKEERAEHD